jgi:hypothetical protein
MHAVPRRYLQSRMPMEEQAWDRLIKELSGDADDRSAVWPAAPNPALCVMKYFPQEVK